MEDKNEHKILLKFIYEKEGKFKRPGLFRKMNNTITKNKPKPFIQNKPFKFGFKIKNLGEQKSPKGIIKNITIDCGDSSPINETVNEQLSFPELNPQEEFDLWWPQKMCVAINGSSMVKCAVEPDNPSNNKFVTYQKNYDHESYFGENEWMDGLIIRGEFEQKQTNTNRLIFILTLLVFLDGVWGLDNLSKIILKIITTLLRGVGWLFTYFGYLLERL